MKPIVVGVEGKMHGRSITEKGVVHVVGLYVPEAEMVGWLWTVAGVWQPERCANGDHFFGPRQSA